MIRTHDLEIIRNPYVILGFVVIAMLVVISIAKMPKRAVSDNPSSAVSSFKRLFKNGKYKEGVLAQLFYVAAQIMCWTFIIQYAGNLGIPKAEAQNYNIVAIDGPALPSLIAIMFMVCIATVHIACSWSNLN